MNQDLITQIAQQQMRALTLLEQTPLTPTRRKLIERHLAINERLTEIACRPPMLEVASPPRDLLDVVDGINKNRANHSPQHPGGVLPIGTGLPDGYLSRDQADHIADRNECGPTQGCDEVQCRGSMPPGVVIDEAADSSIPQQ